MLPIRAPQPQWRRLYRSAFALWTEVWEGVHNRFEMPGGFFTDAFGRHDEAACVFEAETCVAILLFRTMDFSFLDYRRDSYFREFSELDLRRMLAHGTRLFAGTYLTVNPDYRGFHPEVRFKQVVMNVMIRRFLEGDGDVIVNIARRDRDLNKEAMGLGGILLRENVEYFSGRERVDLIYYTRQSVRESDNPILTRFVDQLWSERLDWRKRVLPIERAA